jgi:hypothetical protein
VLWASRLYKRAGFKQGFIIDQVDSSVIVKERAQGERMT